MSRREEVLRRALVELGEARTRVAALEAARGEPIAIVGVGCRFPGANGPDAFWSLLRRGGDAVREVPPDRWDVDAFYDPDPEAPGKTYTRHGGFIDDVDGFDARFFGIPPREAASMDPQHRLVLEVAWEALEHAGIAPDSLRGAKAGVYIGITAADYAHIADRTGDVAAIDAYLSTGNVANFASGRLSYLLGLEGPSMAIDTACSSSLVTTHLACIGLRTGECDLALTGGVNLLLLPETTVALAKARMLSPEGRCKTFDATADGYVRGEGCGIVVLKRLRDAEAAGDDVLAVIRGSAVNQDGRSSGMTVPYAASQEAVVGRALAMAGVEPAKVDYVEAHGTGTPLGDPIELGALGRALAGERERPALIGSVKTNIGHLEAAAGVAGLIKTALALAYGEVPPHLHLREPSPHVDWKALPLEVAIAATPLGAGPRIAGVSSFGISGTNAHVVLESPPAAAPGHAPEPDGPVVVKLSARGEDALAETARRLRRFVREHPSVAVPSIARAACTGRADLPDRAALVVATRAELDERLAAVAAGAAAPGVWRGRAGTGTRPRIAFLVAGQGSRYGGALAGMRRREPAVARTLDELAEVLGPLDEPPLAALLEPGDDAERALAATAVAQPALYALAIALAAWWHQAGVRPDAVAGHSVGAYAAAAVAGVFTIQDGARLVAERGRLMGELPAGGAMVAVMASADVVAAAIDGEPSLAVACVNAEDETVVSGAGADVERLTGELSARGIRTRALEVSHAFHSPLIEPALPALERALRSIELRPPRIALVSDTTGRPVRDDVTDPGYWVSHARRPVDFQAALAAVADLGCRRLIELGPGATLLGLARRHAALAGSELLQSREPHASLARTWLGGMPVDWHGAFAAGAASGTRLPTYPFQHRRHWIADAGTRTRARMRTVPGLVPEPIATPLPQDLYRADIALDSADVLGDHRVNGYPIVPGVAYLELIMAAAERSGVAAPAIESLTLGAALTLGAEERRELQIVLDPPDDGVRRAGVHSHQDGAWRSHAEAAVRTAVPTAVDGDLPLDALRARCTEELDGEAFYRDIWHPRFELGPSFRLIEWIARRDGEAIARLRAAEDARHGPRPELLTIDACVQALVATLPRSDWAAGPDRPLALGTGHRRLTVHRGMPSGPVWCWATLDASRDGGLTGDVRVFTGDGEPVATVAGIAFRRIGAETLRRLAGQAPSAEATDSGRRAQVAGRIRSAAAGDRPALALDYLAGELAGVLGMSASEIDGDEPIASLADSLMLAELKARVEADLGLELPVEVLFDHADLGQLAGWLAARLPAGDADGVTPPSAMTVAELRSRAELEPALAPSARRAAAPPRTVLLTGATGFLGAFLLCELLSRTDADIHCVVRAPATDAALARIAANLRAYELDAGDVGRRVVPVLGDLAQPLLGLDRRHFEALAGSVDAIYHGGAVVKWTYPYAALAAANVGGTREILRLATVRDALPVHFVSTVGVFSSAAMTGRTVAEDGDLEDSGPLTVGYAQTKWVAERMVRNAAGRGIPMTIHRPSIGGDSRTGAFNRHDHLALAISGSLQLGCAPDADLPVQIAPVDFVARALVELSLRDELIGRTFHLVNRDSLTLSELWDVVAACGYPLRRVPLDDWLVLVADRRQAGRRTALDALLPFLTGALETSSLPTFACERTSAALATAGIECPRLDARLIGTYIDGLVAGGYVEPRAREPTRST